MIYEKIKQDYLNARKAKSDTVGILSVLVSDVQTIAKNEQREVTEEDCIKAIKKLLKGVEENLKLTNSESSFVEKELLTSYLPKQMDKEEMKQIISSNGLVGIPDIMKHFKQNYAGRYDAKVLSEVAKA